MNPYRTTQRTLNRKPKPYLDGAAAGERLPLRGRAFRFVESNSASLSNKKAKGAPNSEHQGSGFGCRGVLWVLKGFIMALEGCCILSLFMALRCLRYFLGLQATGVRGQGISWRTGIRGGKGAKGACKVASRIRGYSRTCFIV